MAEQRELVTLQHKRWQELFTAALAGFVTGKDAFRDMAANAAALADEALELENKRLGSCMEMDDTEVERLWRAWQTELDDATHAGRPGRQWPELAKRADQLRAALDRARKNRDA